MFLSLFLLIAILILLEEMCTPLTDWEKGHKGRETIKEESTFALVLLHLERHTRVHVPGCVVEGRKKPPRSGCRLEPQCPT